MPTSAMLLSLASAVLFATSATAFPHGLIARAPVPPDQDPFYVPPAGFENSAPGTVLASRSVSVAFSGSRPLNAEAYQLLYRTTSANGSALATVTTVIKPEGATGTQLVGFATAEDSCASKCAPSYTYQTGADQTNAISQFELFLVIALLNQGYIVSSPDYQGPDSAFSAARLEGHGVLDALRAALSYTPLGLDQANTRIIGAGYSGGAIATGWAAALQPSYAPELQMAGWAYGGTPANLSGTISYIDGTVRAHPNSVVLPLTRPQLFSGFGPAGVLGLVRAYSALATLVERVATDAGKTLLAKFGQQCATDDISDFAFKRFQSTTYQTEGDQILYDPTVQQVTAQAILGTTAGEVPTAPVYIYHAQNDEIIPVGDVETMIDSYCDSGINSLVYELNIGVAEHASEEILAFPNVLTFIADRFNGVTPQAGCHRTQTVLPLFDAGALPAAVQFLAGDILSILTGQVGLDDGIWKAQLTQQAAARGNTPASGAAATVLPSL